MAFHRDPADRRFRHFCETGDPGALGDVFDRTADRLLRVAVWLTGHRADAEDLLQRTFLKVIETRRQFRLGAPVLPWLMGLLGNEARRQRRERDRAAAARPVQDRVVDPEAAVVAREFAATVRSVGDRLGAPYGEVLRLHLEAGLNCKEIAERLERPPGTVRTQLTRALDLLRRRLPAGFAAGATAMAAVGSGVLGEVRAAVLAGAHDATPAAATAVATATSPLRGTMMTKQMLFATSVLAVAGGTVAFMALRTGGTPPAVPARTEVAANESQRPGAAGEAPRRPERVPVGDPLLDPEAVALPRLSLLGAMPGGDPAVVLTADGRRTNTAAHDAAHESALLRIDRGAPWSAVTKLLEEFGSQGTEQVQFAATLPSGAAGCFTLALPANDDAGAVVELRLHRERSGVPPASIVPVLRRIVRGRQDHLRPIMARAKGEERERLSTRFPELFVASVTAPADAPFEQVLQVVAAASQAGVQSVLPISSEQPDGETGNVTSPNRGSYAIDLGPCPRIAITPHSLPPEKVAVTDGIVGCTAAATAPAPKREPGGAGGRFGNRGGQGQHFLARAQLDWSPTDHIDAGIAWLSTAQQPDGSFLGADNRPDLEATALVMLALLAKNTSLDAGEGSEMLNTGIGWILDQQQDDGCCGPLGRHPLRHHALATLVLAEAYGLSYCLELRGSLCDALAWLGTQRQDDGGFASGMRGATSDVVSTASAVMALTTAKFFGVEVPVASMEVMAWFDAATRPDDPTTAAAELFCRFFANPNTTKTEAMVAVVDRLPETADPMDPRCLYWTSCLLFQMHPEPWRKWLDRLGEIARQQHEAGTLGGSWEPAYGNSRITTTALRVLSLQVFYRYARLIR